MTMPPEPDERGAPGASAGATHAAVAATDAIAAGGFVRDTVVLAAGLGAAQLIAWGVLPWWSRLYGPAEFAALALFGAVASVVSMLLMLRYDSGVVVAASDAEARALVRLVLGLALGGGALLAALAALVPAHVLAALGLAPLGRMLPLAVAAGALAAAFGAGLAWANRRRSYVRLSAARVVMALVAALAGVALGGGFGGGFGSIGLGGNAGAVAGAPAGMAAAAGTAAAAANGLLWAQLAGAAAALAVLGFSLAPATPWREAARRHAAAPRYLWPAAMLDAATQQIPLWLTALWFGERAAGQFGFAWRVVALPMLVLAAAAGSVFYQRFAAHQRVAPEAHAAARAMLWRMWRGFALVGAVPALAVAAFGPALFALAFGETWREAGALAAVMMPMLWAMLVSSPTSGALVVLGLQRHAPRFGVAMALYRPAAFAAGAAAGSLALALALWALAEVLAIVLYNRLLLVHLRRGD